MGFRLTYLRLTSTRLKGQGHAYIFSEYLENSETCENVIIVVIKLSHELFFDWYIFI